MKDINRATLIGRTGKDPEIRYTGEGKMVVTFSVATGEGWKDKNGDWQNKTEWHNVVCFGKVAESVEATGIIKGQMVFVEGKITTNKWQDKEGNNRYTTQVSAFSVAKLEVQTAQNSNDEFPRNDNSDDDEIPF